MADRRRLITLNAGGRPVVDLDLEVTSTYQAIADTFAYQPGQSNAQGSREPGRFGGQTIVGEQNDNGTVSWQALVQGATADVAAGNIEALLAAANRTAYGRLLEWRPDGSTYSSYFRVAGPATWKSTYKWASWQGAKCMIVEVSFPVRPLVLWDPMTIGDVLTSANLTDYTFDALTSAALTGTGTLYPNGSLGSERRLRHTVRGYTNLEGQATLKGRCDATATSFKAGVLLRASANTYVEVYVDDDGTNSRLRVDVVIAGVRTTRASTNLAARLNAAGGTFFSVRGRIEGQAVIAEYFSSTTTTPMGAPTTSTSPYTLSGPEQTSLVAGFSGWSWVPQSTNDLLMEFEFRPFTWRNQTLPQLISPLDQIPGTAPALMDVLVTPSGGAAAPFWGLIAWAKPLGTDPSPITIQEAESFTTLIGLTAGAQAGARGGNDARVTTAGAGTFSTAFGLQSLVEADDFTDGRIDVEVWARVVLTSTLVTPRLVAYVSVNAGVIDYTVEYGSTGKALTVPSSGTVYRFVRVGTLTLDGTATGVTQIAVTGSYAAGSTGAFGLDYVILVPARRRAAGVTGVWTGVTDFVPGTAEWTKRIRSDLSATLEKHPAGGLVRDSGMGGALIQPSPGAIRVLVKLSSLIPDNPVGGTAVEQLAHSATVSLDVVPRSFMLRGA